MAIQNRSIRGTLDPISFGGSIPAANNSFSIGLITRIVNGTFSHVLSTLQSQGMSLNQAISQSGYISISTMRDGTLGFLNISPTNFTGSAPNGSLPEGHGINLVDNNTLSPPSSNITPHGFGQVNNTFGSYNQGLRHYAHTVQFGKGASNQTIIGLPNQNNLGFISGGSNLSPVITTTGTYRSVNIKMSEFKTVRKNDPPNTTGFIHNDGNGDEIIPLEGPISIGNAANGPI